MSTRRKSIPIDSLVQLQQRLDRLPKRSPERTTQVTAMAGLYGISPATVYRALQHCSQLRSTHRADRGRPRVLPANELIHYWGHRTKRNLLHVNDFLSQP